jgi:D-alanyl-D-alanine carboxypeptidase
MTRRKKIQESYTTVFVLLFLVVAMMCFLVNMPRSGTVGESYLDVSASMPNNYDIMIMQGNSEYLVLVNKTYGLGSAYEPADLETVASRASDRPAKFQKLRAAAADSFNKMTTDAEEKGLTIAVTTAYRPYSYQKQLYDNYMKSNGAEWTEHYSAEPGHSEHQTGLTADVSCPAVDYELTADFADTAEGKWLAENAHRYGFIIRYPDGKEAITGYKYEPWHIRYVGEQAATEIYNRNLTLEEYLGEV